jgi:hypothetical protein
MAFGNRHPLQLYQRRKPQWPVRPLPDRNRPKNGSSIFSKRCIAFKNMVDVVETLGEGNHLRGRGPENTSPFVNAEDQTIPIKTIIVRTAVLQPTKVKTTSNMDAA